jgi:putative alpha-1,2-mannosidase
MGVLGFVFCVLAHGQIALSAADYARSQGSSDVLDWIDPLIGSKSGGNVFAGATLPYGMAKGLRFTVQHLITWY